MTGTCGSETSPGWLTVWAKELLNVPPIIGCGSFPIRLVVLTNPFFGSLPQPVLSECFFWVVVDSITDDEVGSSGQFMGKSFDGDDFVSLCEFAVIEAFSIGAVAFGKVSGFHIGPSEILVAIFSVILSFLFLV